MTSSVAILIPVHNKLHLTKECLQGLQNLINEVNFKDSVNYSIVLIDDGSEDGTEQWVKKKFHDIHLLKGDGNLWWSGGVNAGAKYAFEEKNFNYVLLWNNDITPDKGYFSNLSRIILEGDEETIAGSKICDLEDHNKIWSMGGVFNPVNGENYMIGIDKEVDNHNFQYFEPDWLTGMGTLIPRNVPEKIGYLNENDFPQYFGDTDYTYRAKLAGFKLKVFPQLVIFNNTANTGIVHGGNFFQLIRTLYSTRSKYNFKKEWKFYRMYAESRKAYKQLFIKYFRYIGGYFKWSFLNLFGLKKSVR